MPQRGDLDRIVDSYRYDSRDYSPATHRLHALVQLLGLAALPAGGALLGAAGGGLRGAGTGALTGAGALAGASVGAPIGQLLTGGPGGAVLGGLGGALAGGGLTYRALSSGNAKKDKKNKLNKQSNAIRRLHKLLFNY